MISKLEAAERIISCWHNNRSILYGSCLECPLRKDCDKKPGEHCINFCENWLKNNKTKGADMFEELTEVLNSHGKVVIMEADGRFKITDKIKETISIETIEKLSDLVIQYNFCESDIVDLCKAGARLGNYGIRGAEAGKMLKDRLSFMRGKAKLQAKIIELEDVAREIGL